MTGIEFVLHLLNDNYREKIEVFPRQRSDMLHGKCVKDLYIVLTLLHGFDTVYYSHMLYYTGTSGLRRHVQKHQ